MLRVRIPVGSLHVSGGVKVLIWLANGMAARGWDVAIVAPDYASFSPFPLERGVRVIPVRTGPRWLPRPLRKAAYYLRLCLLAARECDLCLANYYLTAYCAFASKLLGNWRARVVWYIQAFEAGSHGLLADAGRVSRLIRYLSARLSYKLPVRVLCVSDWVRQRIGRADAEVVNPPALNLSEFQAAGRVKRNGNGQVTIGTIGRRGDTKGYSDFLRAIEELPDPARVRVLVASPEPSEVPLPARTASEAVHARTEREMAQFYRRCDLFVLPSRMEGFPLPPLEAMACGCAVVTTACGGVAEYARHRENCLVVPTGAPGELAVAIQSLCADAALRNKLAQAGADTAQGYPREKGISGFLAALESGIMMSRKGSSC